MRRLRPSDYLRKSWGQGVIARNRRGKVVDPESVAAVQWCMLGALTCCWRTEQLTSGEWAVLMRHLDSTLEGGMVLWQDQPGRTQAEVATAMVDAERKVLGE